MLIAESLTSLIALSPVDGRYGRATESLRPFLSEAGFMAHRAEGEVAWLIALSQAGLPELPRFSAQAEKFLHTLVGKFSEQDAMRIKEIEGVTHHDGKAAANCLKEHTEQESDWGSAAAVR